MTSDDFVRAVVKEIIAEAAEKVRRSSGAQGVVLIPSVAMEIVEEMKVEAKRIVSSTSPRERSDENGRNH